MWHMVALAAISLVDGMNKKRQARRQEEAAKAAYDSQKTRLEKEAQRYDSEVRNPIRQELNNMAMNKLTARGAANDDEIARQFGNLRRRAIQGGAPASSDLTMTLKEMSARQGNTNEDAQYKEQRQSNLRAQLAQMSPAEQKLAELDGQTGAREDQRAAATSREGDESFQSGAMAMAQAGTAWGQAKAAQEALLKKGVQGSGGSTGSTKVSAGTSTGSNGAFDSKDPLQADDPNARF